MSNLALIEFTMLVKPFSEISLAEQSQLAIADWLTSLQLEDGAKDLTARLMKEGWKVYLAVPTRLQTDKREITEWLEAQQLSYSKLDLPRTINYKSENPIERWVVSRLHDLCEFDEPPRTVTLISSATQAVLTSQLNGALLDWQPLNLTIANTVPQATSRFLGSKRSLSIRPG